MGKMKWNGNYTDSREDLDWVVCRTDADTLLSGANLKSYEHRLVQAIWFYLKL